MSVTIEEILSEKEIEARYPDQWVLVDVLDWDAEFEITRGIVRACGDDKAAIHEVAQQLPRLPERRKISIFYTGAWPTDQIYLLNYGLFLTGATQTVIMRSELETAGYDLSAPLSVASIATASQIESVPLFCIDSLMGWVKSATVSRFLLTICLPVRKSTAFWASISCAITASRSIFALAKSNSLNR